MDWWTQNKDAITAIGAAIATIFAVGGIIWAVVKWGVLRGWQRKLRVEVKAFEVIIDPSALLPKLFATENDNSPLADHRITYQPRDPKRDIQAELKAALNHSRYLLITAPTGYGKTREAGVLAQNMMLEGWRVLRIKIGWLDAPRTLPEELNNNRSRVLILLDDLNGLFSTGERTQSPRAEQIPLLSEASYHDRLLQALDMLEGMCTESEIHVLATARSEPEQWQQLNYTENDRLWKRFQRFELPEPTIGAIVNLLELSTKEADLESNQDEFEAIALKSDGTYRNILLNLRRWKAQNKTASKDDFTESLDGSWRDVYENAVIKYYGVKHIYDAIDILRQAKIDLFISVVSTAALAIGNKERFSLLQHQSIQQAMDYLIYQKKIIRTSGSEIVVADGQVEAKGYIKELSSNISGFLSMINRILTISSYANLRAGFIWVHAIGDFIQFLEENNYTDEVKIIRQNCIAILKKCIKKRAFRKYFSVIGQKLFLLGEHDVAEVVIRKSIQLDPTDIASLEVLFVILILKSENTGEIEVVTRKIIELKPSETLVHRFLGKLLIKTNRYDEAVDVYLKAIESNKSATELYYDFANLLRSRFVNRLSHTLSLYEKLIELDGKNFNSYLGMLSVSKELGKDISKEYTGSARQLIPETNWSALARLESICDNFDKALYYLQIGAQKDALKPSWAWKNHDLQWIRDDPRFVEIVGPKPEDKNLEI